MTKFSGRSFATFGAVVAAVLGASTPAAAVRPASPGDLARSLAESAVQPAQFRFPWEAKAKPLRRTTKRTRTTRPKKPAAAARRKPPAAAPAAAPKPEPVDLSRVPLPPDGGPPWIATWREAEEWYAGAGRIPSPDFAPRFASDGALTDILDLMAASLPVAVAAFEDPPPMIANAEAAGEHADDRDRDIPLPPQRPHKTAPPLREGLAPEENALAPEGQGLASEGRGLSPETPPLPPKRPGDVAGLSPEEPHAPPAGPTEPDIPLPVVAHDEDPDCRALDGGEIAEFKRMPAIEGPGVCGGGPLVSLTSVKRADGASVEIKPAATLRCSMAKAFAEFVRSDVASAADGAGLSLVRLDIAGSFQCRGRNGAAGGKMSEHGRANAIDVSGFGFADGKAIGVFSPDLPTAVSGAVRSAACERFSTVLGPGSDGFHEQHLHLDLQPRRSKSSLCQWSDPPVAAAGDRSSEPENDKSGKAESGRKSHAAPKPQAAP